MFSAAEGGFPQIVVAHRKQTIGGSEIRVEADGPLKQGHGAGIIVQFRNGPRSQAVSLQRLEGRRGRFFKRGGIFLDRTERFAQFAA